MLTIAKDTQITPDIVGKYIKLHQKDIGRYNLLNDYYNGIQRILTRTKDSKLADNKLVCNHAKYISDTATGYFAGNPITYQADENILALTDMLNAADSDTQDMDLARTCSKFGVAYDFLYMSENAEAKLASPDPRNAFVVYDDTVEQLPVFGVYYFPLYNDNGQLDGYRCYVSTTSELMRYSISNAFAGCGEVETTPNPFGEVSIVEYYNNAERTGDYEPVISLIDAYNLLQSDRVNDKEQFVNSILAIYGEILGDTEEEEGKAYKSIRDNGLMMMSADAKAEWLTRQMDEASVEILCKSIERDIHKFSNVPCMTDENFSANASGVAMRYKLLGFEQLTKIKERYFKEGLKYRLRMFSRILSTKGGAVIDTNGIDIVFTRSLPVNEVEIAQMVSSLNGIVPAEMLLGQLPFIKDAEQAAEMLREDKAASVAQQQSLFANTPLVTDNEE